MLKTNLLEEARGAALASSSEGKQIIFNLLKEAVDRHLKIAEEVGNPVAQQQSMQSAEQRKDDTHQQELGFNQDKHDLELQKLQLEVESQQLDNQLKAQKYQQQMSEIAPMMPPPSPGQQQGQYVQNLMMSQQPVQKTAVVNKKGDIEMKKTAHQIASTVLAKISEEAPTTVEDSAESKGWNPWAVGAAGAGLLGAGLLGYRQWRGNPLKILEELAKRERWLNELRRGAV